MSLIATARRVEDTRFVFTFTLGEASAWGEYAREAWGWDGALDDAADLDFEPFEAVSDDEWDAAMDAASAELVAAETAAREAFEDAEAETGCGRCHGAGYLSDARRHGRLLSRTCPRCHGAGDASASEIARYEAVCADLGLPVGSRTARELMAGEITRDEAERIAGVVTRRHDETEYDALLARGVDRETAREWVAEPDQKGIEK